MDQIHRSVAKVVCRRPRASGDPTLLILFQLPGAIVLAWNGHCHIIVLWRAVLESKHSSAFQFEVVFPDGTKMELKEEDVKIQKDLAAFTLSTSASVTPVDFSTTKVSVNEDVFSVGFTPWASSIFTSQGRVTHARDGFFSHDCAPSLHTQYGDIVFNKHSKVVGISCKNRGVTIAMDLQHITKVLSLFHANMIDKPLGEILQCTKDEVSSIERKKEEEIILKQSKEGPSGTQHAPCLPP